MASGAPTPGGRRVKDPGGYRPAKAGGTNLNDPYQRLMHELEPDAVIDVVSSSGARVAQTRTVTPRNLGRATGATYAWTLPTRPGGSTATVTNPTAASASFTPDVAGTYVFQCVVTFTGASKTQTLTSTYVSA